VAIHKLKPGWVEKITKNGMYGDGGGLWLQITNHGAGRSWLFRWTDRFSGKGRLLGLGPLHTVDIDLARDTARKYRLLLRDGKDPQAERAGIRLDAEIADGRAKTVRQVFDEWFTAKIAKRSIHTRKAYTWQVRKYVLDVIGDMPIAKVDTDTLLNKVGLRKLWSQSVADGGRHAVAKNLHNILARLFSFAIASKYYHASNPAAWKGHLEHVLPALKDVRDVQHQPGPPHQEIGRFMQVLRAYEDRSVRRLGHPNVALLLEFIVLSGVRMSEARLATYDEMNEATNVWTVPPPHHKIGRLTKEPHFVPITPPMWDVLREMHRRYPNHAPDALIFPTERGEERGKGANAAFNENTVAGFLRISIKWPTKIVPHGFRSTLAGWCQANGYPDALIDRQIGHLPAGKIDQAYKRDQLTEARRPMMDAWGQYCSRPAPEPTAAKATNVASFTQARSKQRRSGT
jgi:integrase